MTVTDIQELTRKRYRVYADGQVLFVLYGRELTYYHIARDQEISEEKLCTIKEEVLDKRCKKRAMNLLMKHSFTERGLKDKLFDGDYPEDVVDSAIEYVKSYGYVDDAGFARDYIFSHNQDKSRRRIISDLKNKGVAPDIIDEVLEDFRGTSDDIDEIPQICDLLRKRRFDPEAFDDKQIRRTYAYLSGKGYDTDIIRKAIEIFIQK